MSHSFRQVVARHDYPALLLFAAVIAFVVTVVADAMADLTINKEVKA